MWAGQLILEWLKGVRTGGVATPFLLRQTPFLCKVNTEFVTISFLALCFGCLPPRYWTLQPCPALEGEVLAAGLPGKSL